MVRALAIVACLLAPSAAAQDGTDLLKQLKGTLAKASADKLSWKPVLEAWAAMPAPPCAAEAGCGQEAIWPGMKDWADYVDEVRQALAATPSRRPSIGIPVVSADGGAAGCA